jgi:membrane-bound serine protease (ClpP class)
MLNKGTRLKRQRFCACMILFAAISLFFSFMYNGNARHSRKRVMVIPVDGAIDRALPFSIKRGIVKAKKFDADIIVLDINTLGGYVQSAILIRDAMIDAKKPTYAYIQRAVSAGALIALSTDNMWMKRGSVIGAAQPFIPGINSESENSSIPKGKMISYVSREFAATASRKNHNEDIAKAFVDPDYGLKGIQEKGRPLTLTDEVALKENFIAGVCEDFDDFLEKIGFKDAEVKISTLTNAEHIARFISNPIYSWVFLVIGIMGLFVEFKTPGFGGGGLVGGIALILFFWGNHLAMLTNWLEIIIFFIGILLILLEIFVIPGFGFAGISGISLVVLSIFMSLIRMPPSGFHFDAWRLLAPSYTILVALVAGTIAAVLLIKYLPETWLWKRLELSTEETSLSGHYAPPDLTKLIGITGETDSTMRPAGVVRIDGIRYDAKSQCGFIKPDTKVRVINVESASLVVEEIEEEESENKES